jgi:maleylacetate reductase
MQSGTLIFPVIERLVYGEPAAQAVAAEAARRGAQRVFILASGTLNRSTDAVARMRAALGSRCAGVFDRMPSFTPREAVLEATAAARAAQTDLVVTFGGGSVTDGGKMLRLCLQNNVTTLDGFDAFRSVTQADGTRTVPRFDGPRIVQIAVPTTLAGGEFNNQAGCTDLRVQVKHGYRHADLMPRTVILDPAPSVHAPLRIWLSTGMRAVDHAVEGICSQFAHPGGDANFIHALKLLSGGLRAVKREPGNLAARLDCAMGVWLSMAGRQGRAQMGASHALGHVLGGSYEIPQGDASSIVLPRVLRFNRSVNAAQQRTVADAMGCPDDDAADVVAALAADIGMPSTLREVGIERAAFAAIADHAMHENWLHSNPRPITDAAQIMEILNAAA